MRDSRITRCICFFHAFLEYSMHNPFALRQVSLAVATVAALAAVAAVSTNASAVTKVAGTYVTGDFHNHTTCSDGTLSVQKLVTKSVDTFGLDWFVQSGHGGNGTRNCTLTEDDTLPGYVSGYGPTSVWSGTIGNDAVKGDFSGSTSAKAMWAWQRIEEYQYPLIEQLAYARQKPIFLGLEHVVPGHEHASMSIIDGQLPDLGSYSVAVSAPGTRPSTFAPATPVGNATQVGIFEYCFDRADTDTSRRGGQSFSCAVTGSSLNAAFDATAQKLTGSYNTGTLGHSKTVEGVKWLGEFHPQTSYYVPAHLERAGAFKTTSNGGFNVESLRDFNNAAPTVSFGFESMPGHQAEINRGSYSTSAAGGGTYGGVGVYAAAVGGVWDALLGEGRNWWFFASSDYHNRGSFGADSRYTTSDFFPGEYTKDYVLARTGSNKLSTQHVVDALRSGNSYVVNGGLIDRLGFVACTSYSGLGYRSNAAVESIAATAAASNTDTSVSGCASMGEKLTVRPGADIVVSIVVRDPVGTNNSPFSFPNPSLAQLSISQPLNTPVLDHVDVIGGKVTGYVKPTNTAAYAGTLGSAAATNSSAGLVKTFNSGNWTSTNDGWRRMTFRIPAVAASQYVRLRGTNLPVATPYETDASGNPILDFNAAGKIPCTDSACPSHLTTTNGVKYSSYDVAAWSDLWFYSNPIYVEVQGAVTVAGIK